MVDVVLKRHGNTAELLLSGRIDSNTTIELEKTLLELAKRYESMTLDFGKVPYISSAGLRTLYKLHKEMRSKGGVLLIRKVRKDVLDVFQATGFICFLNIEDV